MLLTVLEVYNFSFPNIIPLYDYIPVYVPTYSLKNWVVSNF